MANLREIEEIEDQGIVLSDGCRLSARVWRPVDAGDDPVPVILEYLPYRKRDGTCARDALTHPYLAKRGYACVRVDMRGNGDSEGLMEDEYTAQELSDAVEVINWLAAQPWCSGKVGMMGISWGGFNGLQVAALNPEPLKAVITLCSTVDRYADDIHYKGGCLLNENLGWGSTMWAYSSRPPDPALRPDWREMWMQRLEAEPFLPVVWLGHQTRDAYWKHGSICEDYSALKAKVLAVGGWGDAYKNAVPQIVENLPGAKGIVGPWVHKYPHFAVPEPRIGFLQEALRWWDKWLKGIDSGVEDDPDLSLYVMDGVRPKTWYAERPGRWIDHVTGLVGCVRYHLEEGGALGPRGERFETQIMSPADTGMEGGEYCAIWLGPEMPGDQRADDAKSACWDSAPLAEEMPITGSPEAVLRLRSEAVQGQVAVRLNHVHPDGASTRITYGVLNLTHRGGHDSPTELVPGEEVEIRVKLDHIAYVVPEGHRIRVAVSNAYWPLVWPAPEAGVLTVTGGWLDMPERESVGVDERGFPPPEAESPWEVETLREAANSRRIERDMGTGIVSLIIEDDFGKRRDLGHGLITGGKARERWEIHPDDPLRARGITHWTEEMQRGEIRIRTETHAEMRADRENFFLKARLEAYENDVLVFEKDVAETIPRDGV
ncbi:CocE/NonD family hydrolase [Marimonas arenosa]|uniref:CocE/NonD family hydrolase n=1 Tax=Marimonas arenosa TaxID=1795305 RepID=A0AAE4B5A2_9RHOB|nr:CocE/NonD family hydrolase [Marimonas arenosa]MDQ2091100.1 CocE/NonD family hydrolase [Marimonas arenosa]